LRDAFFREIKEKLQELGLKPIASFFSHSKISLSYSRTEKRVGFLGQIKHSDNFLQVLSG